MLLKKIIGTVIGCVLIMTYCSVSAQQLSLGDAVLFSKKPIDSLKNKLIEFGYKQTDLQIHMGDTGWTYTHETATYNNLILRKVIMVRFKGKQLANYFAYITSDSTEAPLHKKWIEQNQYVLTKTDKGEIKTLSYKKENTEVEIIESKVYDNWTNYGYNIHAIYPK